MRLFFKVFYQQPTGGFNIVSYPKPDNIKYEEVEVADLNSDGKADMVFMKFTLTSGIHLYLQSESGFEPYVEYNVTNIDNSSVTLNGIGVGDLNHDGRTDIATSRSGNRPQSKIIVWYQNETNTFETPTIVPSYDIPEPVEIADFNNDGKNELITLNGGWQKVSCYEQTTTNTLD